MTTDVAVRQPTSLSLSEKITYAQALADSNLLPAQYRKNPPNLLFAMEYAEALGVATIHALTSIHVIDGKPSASADLIGTMVRRAGHRLRVSGDDTYALAQIIRADDPDFTFESRWDAGKARAAGLWGKGNWSKYPGAMFRARAITEVARAAAPDALFGIIYTPEELGAEVDAEGAVISAPSTRPDIPAAPPQSAADRVRGAMRTASPAAAEVVDTETTPQPISASQLTALNAGLTNLGYRHRPAIYALLTAELGRPIGSSAEVTRDEASRLLDRLHRGDIPAPTSLEPEPRVATPAPVEVDDTFVEEPPADWTPET